ncbi:Big1p [Lachancea thermotolerans CBS 6340]|uniref:Protein BIG1 n=1 Tax=Lachancea thermotolerans (strain ATCC 56472 / CBS 6340 / NRRL Y-8284) TaxID=559295 RepID=C5DJI6_LACTC|nr:KLTH0F16720p [Lachancea thermotolerans CBS 6340]CAR24475.1 KLTH0F16720p [Lachancea thermotolerans CBS 6340]
MNALWCLAFLTGLVKCLDAIKDTVPAILCSYKLSPGMMQFQVELNGSSALSKSEFLGIAKTMISRRHSDAYVLVDIPGLAASDFSVYEEEMEGIRYFVQSSSTALGFSEVNLVDTQTDVFEELANFTKEEWDVDIQTVIRGEVESDFVPYIDSNPRIIRINFKPLPEENTSTPNSSRSRQDVIEAYDDFLKKVLRQLPSPEQTIILTSSQKPSSQVIDGSEFYDILPDLFQDPQKLAEVEINDKNLHNKPQFNEPKPRHSPPSEERLSILEPQFLEENRGLVVLIIISIALFFVLQTIQLWRGKPKQPDKTKITTEKKLQ